MSDSTMKSVLMEYSAEHSTKLYVGAHPQAHPHAQTCPPAPPSPKEKTQYYESGRDTPNVIKS